MTIGRGNAMIEASLFAWVFTPEGWVAFMTLAFLEIVLGIDNLIFISILVDKLPKEKQARTRFIGLSAALVMRILLLFSITWLMGLSEPLFQIAAHPISIRDLILIVGGLFLLGKTTLEIHHAIDPEDEVAGVTAKPSSSFAWILIQIVLLDLVFSLDSVLTAVGMTQQLGIMVAAVVIAMIFMMVFASTVHDIIKKHPTLKMLALSFLLLIGMVLIGEGFGLHIAKGYIYFAIGFSLLVEGLNIASRKRRKLTQKNELQ